MKKDKKFLAELEKNLMWVSSSKKKEILDKYSKIISLEKKKKKKIVTILKELGDPKEIALKEKALLNDISFFNRVIDLFLSYFKLVKNFFVKLSKKINKLVDIIKDKFNKVIISMKNFINKLKRKRKIKQIKDKIENTIEEIKEDVIEFKKDAVDEIIEVKEDVIKYVNVSHENVIVEPKEVKRKRIIKDVCYFIVLGFFLILWLMISSLFMSSIIAYLDGIKMHGVCIILFGLSILFLWIVVLVNNLLFKKKIDHRVNLCMIIGPVFLCAIGIALSINFFNDIEIVHDVSDKYSMTTKTESYFFSSDETKNFYINFNANYNTKYIIEYDEKLDDKVKIQVKYYESYYDYFVKKNTNEIYVSLSPDTKDRISVYLDDLKEKKIYDNNELSRYVVKIFVSEENYKRLVILN